MHIPKSPAEARVKRKEAIISDDLCGAENETRTRDPNLGKVVLYQLSYFRNLCRRTFPFFSIGIAKIWIISLSPKFFNRQRHKQRYNHDRLRLSAIVLSFSLISCDKDTSGIEPFDASLLIGKWMMQGQLDGYYNPETGEIQDGEYDDVTDLEVFVTFTEDGRCISEVNETEYSDYVLVEGDYKYSQESRTLTTTANGITTTYDVNELTADRLVMTIYDEWSFGTRTTYVRISE